MNLRNASLMLLMVFNLGCAEIATQVAVQGAVQYGGEQYLISQNKPMTRCNIYNVAKGNKMCRIYRQYRRA